MTNEFQKAWDLFLEKVKKSSKVQKLMKVIGDRSATYSDAQEYSSLLSDLLVQSVSEIYPTNSEDVLKALKDSYFCKSYFSHIDNYAYSMQKVMNQANNIGLNAVKPSLKTQLVNDDTVYTNNYDLDIKRYKDLVELSGNKRVDTIQQANAKFQDKAGYGVTVSRKYDGRGLSDGRTCKWCLERVGSNIPYKQAVSRGMFQRHEGCHCIIEYNNNGEKTRQYSMGSRYSWYKEHENIKEQKDVFQYERRIAKAEGKPYDATNEWLYNESGKKGKVNISDSVVVDGKKYTVSGNFVVQDHNETEIKIANMIAEKTGKNVSLLPRVNFPLGVKTADYEISNEFWDLKTIKGKTKNTLCNAIKNKKGQSDNFIFELTDIGLEPEKAIENIENVIFKYDRYSFVKKVMVVNKEKIYKVFEK